MNSLPNKRISWVDAAKGYGTFLVILGHIGFGRAHQWIYSFHLPLFFFLSGFSFSLKNSFGEFLRRRIKTLFIPCICLSATILIANCIRMLADNTLTIDYILRFLVDILVQHRFTALWFISCLFVLNLVFYAIIRFTNEWLGAGISVLMAVAGLIYYANGGPSLPWNFDVCFTAAPFFYSGYLMKKHSRKVENLLSRKFLSYVILFGSLMLNIVFWLLSARMSDVVFDMYGSTYAFPPLSYPAAFAGILFMIVLSKKLDYRFVRYVGQNSLLYYAWHQQIIWPLIIPVFNFFGVYSEKLSGGGPLLLYNFAIFFVTIGVATLFNFIITHSKLKFIVGK